MSLISSAHSFHLQDTLTLLALTRCRGMSGTGALRLALGHARRQLVSAGLHPSLGKDLNLRETQVWNALLEDQTLSQMRMSAHEEQSRHHDMGGRIVGFFDADYPPLLRLIPRPPPVLFILGNIDPLLSSFQIKVSTPSQPFSSPDDGDAYFAVIGTRHPSDRGTRRAYDAVKAILTTRQENPQSFSKVIVSGLALGVDATAHQTTLNYGGYTVAILGHGLAQCYPKRHRALANHIISAQGALITEQPLDTSPHPYSLIARDRIQSGLSAGVIVSETGSKGGSLHTVRSALRQGRLVCLPEDHRVLLSNMSELSDPEYRHQILWIDHDIDLARSIHLMIQYSMTLAHKAQNLYQAMTSLPKITYAHTLCHKTSNHHLSQQRTLFD